MGNYANKPALVDEYSVTVDFDVDNKADFPYSFTWSTVTDPNEPWGPDYPDNPLIPVDITDCTGSFQIWQAYEDEAPALEGTIVLQPLDEALQPQLGVIDLLLTRDNISTLKAINDRFVFTVHILFPTNIMRRFAKGKLNIID